ncbi:nitrate- and nitrite sensing domain-containing protein [Cellulomonas hominis]
MLRRLGIRAKVLAVLAVPMLLLVAAAAFISSQAIGEARTARAVDEVVGVFPHYFAVVSALQDERALTLQLLGGEAVEGPLEQARDTTDSAISRLATNVDRLDLTVLDSRAGEAVQQAATDTARITQVRTGVDAGSVPAALADTNFTDMISSNNDVPQLVAQTLSDPELASRMSAYGLVARTVEQVLRSQPLALAVLADDGADDSQVRELAALFAVGDQARDDARAATNKLRISGVQVPTGDADFTAMQLSLSSGNTLTLSAMDPDRWSSLSDAEIDALQTAGAGLLSSASDLASSQADQAQQQAVVTIAGAAVAALASLLIALVVARGIVVPLRRLTAAAGDVREQLPTLVEQVAVPGEGPGLELVQIPVESSDEVGRLAAAFNAVNATTLQVAQEQAALRGSIAEMFINVARRDQVLLGRQLSFIDSLERSEEDPAALANLFRLDHLATRMRRNAESLLVLAGIDSGRRLREAMPLSDVIRTASSEIEQYDRVHLDLRVDPQMHGFNALGAAHLLAELLENATIFSEPETPVEVSTGVDGDLVTVEIRDRGLGMSEAELEVANTRIRSTAASDALGAQRLGLFVVGRIAHRLGAQVDLQVGPDGTGMVARVGFPGGLFAMLDHGGPGGDIGVGEQAGPATPADVSLVGADLGAGAPPTAAPVDLAALTDGETTQGLPRRRARSDETSAVPVPPSTAPQDPSVPRDRDFVLPAPTEAVLPSNLASAGAAWTPLAAPSAPSVPSVPGGGLPLRARAETDGLPAAGPAVPAPEPSAPAAPAPARSGLFAAFRGRSELAPAEEAPAEPGPVLEPVPADDALTGGADLLAWSDAHDDQLGDTLAGTQVDTPFVVPALEPDDDAPVLDEAHAWGVFRGDVHAAAPAGADGLPETPAAEQVPAWFAAGDDGVHPVSAPVPAWQAFGVDESTEETDPGAPVSETPPEQPLDVWLPLGGPALPVEPAAGTTSWAASADQDAGERLDPLDAAPVEVRRSSVWAVLDGAGEAAPESEPAADRAPVDLAPDHASPERPEEPVWQPFASWSPTAGEPLAPQSEGPAVPEPASPAGQGGLPGTAAAGWVPEPAAAAAGLPEPSDAARWTPGSVGAAVPAATDPEAVEVVPAPFSWQPPTPGADLPDAVVGPHDGSLPAFADLVRPEPTPDRRRRWSLFGRRKPASAVSAPADPGSGQPTPTDDQGGAPAGFPTAAAVLPFGEGFVPEPVAFVPAGPAGQSSGSTPFPALDLGTPDLGVASFGQPGPAADAGLARPPAPEVSPVADLLGAPGERPDHSFVPEQSPDGARAAAADGWPTSSPSGGSPVRASVWSALPVRGRADQGAARPTAPAGSAASAAPLAPSAGVVPAAPAAPTGPASFVPAPVSSWSPDGRYVRPDPTDGADGSPYPVPGQSAGPHAGALDEDVAAMLALRSNIQEQALSELSQLSAYRPSSVSQASRESLSRRVPTAIPPAPPIASDHETGRARDAEELRERLSSFQSGSRRGRRAVDGPVDAPVDRSRATSDETTDPTEPDGSSRPGTTSEPPTASVPPAPTW